MANAYKILYQGQLPNSATTLATVPGGKSWVIKDISMVNTDVADRTAALYHGGTASTNLITPSAVTIVAGGMYAFSGGTITLAAADTIAGIASVASKITTTISGDEIT